MTAIARTLLILFALSSVHIQSLAQTSTGKLEKEVQQLRADLNDLRKSQEATSARVTQVTQKLDDTAWKALDFASQLSSAQWAMFGAGLTILSLLIAVVAFGAYHDVIRRMESKLNSAAENVERHLEGFVQKEEARLHDEIQKNMMATAQSVQARIYTWISHAFWEQHSRSAGVSDVELDEKRRNLETAIYLSKRGLEHAAKIDTIPADGEDILTHLRGNTAYYPSEFFRFANAHPRFRELFTDDDRETALELARLVQATAREAIAVGKHRRHAPDWLESACWVFRNVRGEKGKTSVLPSLRELYEGRQLYENGKAADEMRGWIRQRYFENKEPTWN